MPTAVTNTMNMSIMNDAKTTVDRVKDMVRSIEHEIDACKNLSQLIVEKQQLRDRLMKKVYQYYLDEEYSSGIILVAANNEDEAHKVLNEYVIKTHLGGTWKPKGEVEYLMYAGKKPCIIVESIYEE